MKSTHEQLTENRIDFQEKIIRSGHWVSCLNCEYFKDKHNPEVCMLYKMRPPAHVIVNGCKDHIDDIPF